MAESKRKRKSERERKSARERERETERGSGRRKGRERENMRERELKREDFTDGGGESEGRGSDLDDVLFHLGVDGPLHLGLHSSSIIQTSIIHQASFRNAAFSS